VGRRVAGGLRYGVRGPTRDVKGASMAGRGPQTFKKRQKEQQRKEKQQEKKDKRIQRKLGNGELGPSDEDDPDLMMLRGPNGEPMVDPDAPGGENDPTAAPREASQDNRDNPVASRETPVAPRDITVAPRELAGDPARSA